MAAEVPPPCVVADDFVKKYYAFLSKCPENAHKFYAESSLLGWPESDGVITPVTTLSAINDKILSSNYKNCFAEIHTIDAQASKDGGVFVAVTGSFLEKEKVMTIFFQTFFLARQEKGFFILNDILRVLNACGSGADDAPTEQCEASDISAIEDTIAKVNLSAPSYAPAEKPSSVAEPAANANVSLVARTSNANVSPASAPAENANVPLVVGPTSNANVSPAAAPAGNANLPLAVEQNVSPVVAPASNVALKITYATVVAKTTPVSSPRAASVTPKAASLTPRAAPVTPKASVPSLANGAPKPIASFTKVTIKSKTGDNSAPDTNGRPEVVAGRAVYLGNLPYDVTKQRVAEVLRKFGPVRRHPDSVQIRRHSKDGFCCAFVEFESPDSARVAVEAHNVNFGEKEAYIAYKKSSYNRGPRSSTRGGSPNNGIGGKFPGYRHVNENQSGRARATERSPSSGPYPRVRVQDKQVEVLD